jgi:hypothetical protein
MTTNDTSEFSACRTVQSLTLIDGGGMAPLSFK